MAVMDRTKGTRKLLYTRRAHRFERKNKCIDCRGRGVTKAYVSEYSYEPAEQCRSCRGSGTYEDYKRYGRKSMA
ncbi:hypothetical protein ACFO4L_00145 [Bacillus daqingensis]|uniref:Uncharacterized protein n=2 Tax=Bacillaceae TaxID=186817 RepID=A0A969PS74_9BACI|nr:hypothetical protein [Alkalicoccus luteus]NJP38565.1 hypothetical protein [Alkalicoccus luteus]